VAAGVRTPAGDGSERHRREPPRQRKRSDPPRHPGMDCRDPDAMEGKSRGGSERLRGSVVQDLFDISVLPVPEALIELPEISQDDGQQVIEVVRNGPGELANQLHLP